MNNDITFITCASKQYGLGHLMRLKILQKKLNKKINSWIIIGKKSIIKKNLKNQKVFYLNKIDKKKIYLILKKNHASKVIIDASHANILKNNKMLELQNFLKIKKMKIISFDLPHQKKIVADISIMPFGFKRKILKDKKTKLYRGYNYILTEGKQVLKKQKKNNRKKILIVIGGTDPLNLSLKIYNFLKNLPYNFKVIVGENKIKKQYLKNNTNFVKFSKNIKKDIYKSDLVICGESNTKYQSILSLKPTILIHQYDIKSEMIKDFLNKKVVCSLGLFSRINKQKLINLTQELINDNSKIKNKLLINIKRYFNYNLMLKNQKILLKHIDQI